MSNISNQNSKLQRLKRGIYLVANLRSQHLCENLIYSIRSTGCTLPIRLIHFGGQKINSKFILSEVEFLDINYFSEAARTFVTDLKTVLNDCPAGFLYRFFAWFGDWDEFIYSDNDVVALTNWEGLFEFMPGYDLVHADEEYTTRGKYNYNKAEDIERIFGDDALETAITAGQFTSRKNSKIIADMIKAVQWFRENPEIPIKHDQTFIHIASLLGNWKMYNLCKPPNNWLSSWAGDYKNTLELIHSIQSNSQRKISHIHYSGGAPNGQKPIQELLFSSIDDSKRLKGLASVSFKYLSGFSLFKSQIKRSKRILKSIIHKYK